MGEQTKQHSRSSCLLAAHRASALPCLCLCLCLALPAADAECFAALGSAHGSGAPVNRFAAKKEDESADNLKLLGHVYDKIHQAFLQCVRPIDFH
jgi:hypothetical protein